MLYSSSNWPSDSVQRVLYGDIEIVYLAKLVGFSSDDTANLVNDFAKFKKGCVASERIIKSLNMLMVYPISSADCERGFSCMNLAQTSV